VKEADSVKGHGTAPITILIWGTTSISTKSLLTDFKPIEVLFYRFGIGLLLLLIAYPHRLKGTSKKQELTLNILFLGLCASALCFVTWNLAVRLLGAVKTSIYIYLVPVITAVTSVIVLSERITWISALGTILTLAGLFISEKKVKAIAKEL